MFFFASQVQSLRNRVTKSLGASRKAEDEDDYSRSQRTDGSKKQSKRQKKLWGSKIPKLKN